VKGPTLREGTPVTRRIVPVAAAPARSLGLSSAKVMSAESVPVPKSATAPPSLARLGIFVVGLLISLGSVVIMFVETELYFNEAHRLSRACVALQGAQTAFTLILIMLTFSRYDRGEAFRSLILVLWHVPPYMVETIYSVRTPHPHKLRAYPTPLHTHVRAYPTHMYSVRTPDPHAKLTLSVLIYSSDHN
jgi:hypothetical protein